MHFLAATAIATGAALASSVSYAQLVHVEKPALDTPVSDTDVNRLIPRPKKPIEFAININYIFDHDLLLKDTFYSEKNLKDVFDLRNVFIANDKDGISVISSEFAGIFPKKVVPGYSNGSLPSASLVIRKSTQSSGLITAGLNFGMDEFSADTSYDWTRCHHRTVVRRRQTYLMVMNIGDVIWSPEKLKKVLCLPSTRKVNFRTYYSKS
jgi:hypothetical protein